MQLTGEQREVLRVSFDGQLPLTRQFGVELFERLGESDPELASGSPAEVEARAMRFVQLFTAGLVELIDEGRIPDSLRRLGVELHGSGVLSRDYDTIGRTLTALFEERLAKMGDPLTPEARAAWLEAWELLSIEMQKAAIAASSEE